MFRITSGYKDKHSGVNRHNQENHKKNVYFPDVKHSNCDHYEPFDTKWNITDAIIKALESVSRGVGGNINIYLRDTSI